MTLEQVWDTATADKSNSFFKGNKSLFTIQNGCKIERFEDGVIVLFNTRVGNNFYKRLTKWHEIEPFTHGGWHYGTYITTIRTYLAQIEALNVLIQKQITDGHNPEVRQLQRKNLIIKLHETQNYCRQRFKHIDRERLEADIMGKHIAEHIDGDTDGLLDEFTD